MGLLTVAVSTGLIFARVSKPTARVAFSDVAVITKVDGMLTLMIRLANRRMNQIVDARATVTLSFEEKTSEGQEYRNPYDLKLERDTSSAFALTWTVAHEITPDSKLHGFTLEKLRERDAILFVTLVGIDETFNQTVHARFSYLPEDIRWDHDFKDMFLEDPEGGLIIDLAAISETDAVKSNAG